MKGIVAETGYCDCRSPTPLRLTIRASTPNSTRTLIAAPTPEEMAYDSISLNIIHIALEVQLHLPFDRKKLSWIGAIFPDPFAHILMDITSRAACATVTQSSLTNFTASSLKLDVQETGSRCDRSGSWREGEDHELPELAHFENVHGFDQTVIRSLLKSAEIAHGPRPQTVVEQEIQKTIERGNRIDMRACWCSPSTAPLPRPHCSNHICASFGHRHGLDSARLGAAHRLRSPVCKEIALTVERPAKHHQEDQP